MAQRKKSEIQAMSDDDVYILAKNELRIPAVAQMGNTELRNAVLAHLSAKSELIDDGGAPVAAVAKPGATAVAAMATPVGAVSVRHGAYSQDFPNLVGKTIAQAHAALRDTFSIEENPRIYLGGTETTNLQHTLKAGETLEFQKRTSAKGK
jgi:hypothetical protein